MIKLLNNMIFTLLSYIMCKTFVIKRFGSDEYLTANFSPLSLPSLGADSSAHIFEIAHPEGNSKISIFKLVCVPRLTQIPDVVLDATKEQDKLTYFDYDDNLSNEEFQVIRYEDAFIIVREGDCVTYNRDKDYFYTMECAPKHPEQLFELIPRECSVLPEKIPLDTFMAQPPPDAKPLITSE